MTERVLVCGSIAFDTIAVFEGYFKDHILPDSIKTLSVSFFVPSLRKEWGGCAGNISYTLNMLGGQPVPVGAVGSDGVDYVQRLQNLRNEAEVRENFQIAYDESRAGRVMVDVGVNLC